MKNILLISIILLNSCSTMTRSRTLGAVTGALVCGILGVGIGKELSPDVESNGLNKGIGGTVGATACGALGYFFGGKMYKSDPRNFEGKPLDFKDSPRIQKPQETLPEATDGIDLSDLGLEKSSSDLLPLLKDMPKELKSQVKRQELIKYKVKPQTLKTKDGRLIHFSGGEAIEHRYIDTKGDNNE